MIIQVMRQTAPSSAAASVTISLIRRPKSSSTTTTSPRAMSVPLTSRSAGALAARSSSTTSPGCSESSSCTVMRVRPISTVTSMATCRSRSRLPRWLRRVGQGHLQGEGGLVLAVGQQRDGDEHALVAQPVEGGDRLLHALGGDAHPAERGGGGLEGGPQRGGDVHLADGGVVQRLDDVGGDHQDHVAADLAGQAGGDRRGGAGGQRDGVGVADRGAGDQLDRGGHQRRRPRGRPP